MKREFKSIALWLIPCLIAAALMLARLGHYSLWDDEALVALSGKAILRTGDTSIFPDDHNLVAYRGGILVKDLHDRSTPPLASYLAAASIGILGQSSLAARLPFALLGLGTLGLLAIGVRRLRANAMASAMLALLVAGNVSLFLFSRQCRYYAPAIFFTTAATYLYLTWDGSRRRLVLLSASVILLFASNPLNSLALQACLLLDHLAFGRRERSLSRRDWAVLLLPQLIGCAAIALIWSPLHTRFGAYVGLNTWADRMRLFGWNWRDLNHCEFFCGGLMALAFWGAVRGASPWLKRGCVAVAAYIAVISACSPQPVAQAVVADVRYLVPLIPICLALQALWLDGFARRRPGLALALALAASSSNLLHGAPGGLRSTLLAYASELLDPPSDPYTEASKWLSANVPAGKSIRVSPDYMAYPLMYHRPELVYAWQLPARDADPQFKGLPPIHFEGRERPDLVLSFGSFGTSAGVSGSERPLAIIDHYWRDVHRPELFWRSFAPVRGYNRETEAIYLFSR